MSPEGRDIHDCRPVNEGGSKYDHPPALQATHKSLAKLVLWWKERHPRVPLRICKIDVAKSFDLLTIFCKCRYCLIVVSGEPKREAKNAGIPPRIMRVQADGLSCDPDRLFELAGE